MVGVFCLISTTIVLFYFGCDGLKKDIDPCPKLCNCLGEYVECNNKNFKRFPSDLPDWTVKLDLSDNQIQNINKTKLDELVRLSELKLNRNRLSKLSPATLIHKQGLEKLEMNRNHLEAIEALSFKTCKNLTILKLKRNRISRLSDGAFWGLESIHTLELDYNHVSSITKTWVYGLQHLKSLSLQGNVVAHIELDVWDCCRGLTDLNLSSNRIRKIHKWTFNHLHGLTVLKLNDNNITYIEEGAFINVPSLKELYLNDNRLSWTIEDSNVGAFVGLGHLLKLHLAGNVIRSVSDRAFSNLTSIVELDLSRNEVSNVQNNSFALLSNLKFLMFNSSSLVCDCKLQWFLQWLQNKKQKNDIYAKCAYPAYLRNHYLLDLWNATLTCDDDPRPRLLEQPNLLVTALNGRNVSLTCRAVSSSHNDINFAWKRDNVEIRSGTSVSITHHAEYIDDNHTAKTSKLHLRNVTDSDQGRYQCIVTNSFGTTYSQKSRVSVLTFPEFRKTPRNKTVEAGDMVRLECAADGLPQPQIAWTKDGGNDFPAARERRMHVMPTDDVFFIAGVKAADGGVYSCTAQNLAGIIIANATLTVHERPLFVKPMEDKEIPAGDPVVLECMASGSPKPTLTWLKDGEPIRATDRHFFTAEDQLMIIVDTTLSDAGRYECVMNNSLGTAKGRSQLLIIPGPTVTDDDMMGIIIITIVCCAVGTSVVWVVIIYQTRRRIAHHRSPSEDSPYPVTADVAPDSISERSSCKDSGTGDSARRSSVDAYVNISMPPPVDAPLLSEDNNRLTNHDRDCSSLTNIHITD